MITGRNTKVVLVNVRLFRYRYFIGNENQYRSIRETQVLRIDSAHESQRSALNVILNATLSLKHALKGRVNFFNCRDIVYLVK